jgi:hypothetical protein
MADRCGASHDMLELVGTYELQLHPKPDTHYKVVDCLLGELKSSGIPFKLGFVGNEAYPENRQ